MKVLMIGATGTFAGLVLPELVRRGVHVRALVRDSESSADARRGGAHETVVGDLLDPSSLRAAAEGMEGVFHINPAFASDEAQMGVNMVEAAVAAGVRKFAFSGVYHPSIASMVNHAAKAPVEEALYASGLDFTVLQPAMFLQLLDATIESAERDGVISGAYSKRARMSYVDYRDVAEAAALALTGDALSRGTFELAAPGMWDRVELADLLSRILARDITARETSIEGSDISDMPAGPVRDGLERMNAHYDAHGFPGGNALVLRAVLGREPRTLEAYVRERTGRGADSAT